ncbi:MAG: hypothetical protein R3A44_38895 [Caldilineaceae bacterium]
MPLGQKQNLITTVILVLFLMVFVVITSYFLALYLRNSREASAQDQLEQIRNSLTVLDIEMYDNYYGEQDTNVVDPPIWQVKPETPVLINMRNHGQLNHNWAIVNQGEVVPVPFAEGQASTLLYYQAGMVYGNNETTFTFNAPGPGEYQIICTVEGHYPSMQGKLVVE